MDIKQAIVTAIAYVKGINTVNKFIASITPLAAGVLQYFTGFFTYTVTVPRWVLFALPLGAILLVWFITFIHARRVHKPKFKAGEMIRVKAHNIKYFASGYSFFWYRWVKCMPPEGDMSQLKYIHENNLEHASHERPTAIYRSSPYNRNPRRSLL